MVDLAPPDTIEGECKFSGKGHNDDLPSMKNAQ
jgi:hypothetical protein